MRFILLIVGVIAAVAVLNHMFPYVLDDPENRMHALYSGMMLMLVASSLLARRERKLSETARDALIWLVIILVCVAGYSYRDVVMNSRIVAELMPSRPMVLSDGSISVRSGDNGHFFLNVDVNGVPVRFMVDTGASDIVLSPKDARRVGFNVEELNFNHSYQTANGIVKGAQVQLDLLEAGGVKVKNVPASVNGAEMDGSLLGMSFLRLFKGYKVEDGTLVLTP